MQIEFIQLVVLLKLNEIIYLSSESCSELLIWVLKQLFNSVHMGTQSINKIGHNFHFIKNIDFITYIGM